MYFVGLKRMKNVPEPLLHELDDFLKKYYKSLDYFTPNTIARELRISEEMAWDLTFELRNMGAISSIFVSQCRQCKKVYRQKNMENCRNCGSKEEMQRGYYFIVS